MSKWVSVHVPEAPGARKSPRVLSTDRPIGCPRGPRAILEGGAAMIDRLAAGADLIVIDSRGRPSSAISLREILGPADI